jgi:hypothetical protein
MLMRARAWREQKLHVVEKSLSATNTIAKASETCVKLTEFLRGFR